MSLPADGWHAQLGQHRHQAEADVCSLNGCRSNADDGDGCFLIPPAGRKWVLQYSRNLGDSNQSIDSHDNGEADDVKRGADVIADALNRLTFEQREDAYHDIHGIVTDVQSTDIEEDPTMIQERLIELDKHMQAILNDSSIRTSALKEAVKQCPDYVCNESFRLSFLRADEWKPSDAADRINRFFQMKSELFPKEKLTKNITQSDLDGQDRAFLSCGTMQATPLKDRSGRSIIISLLDLNPPVFTELSCVSLNVGCNRNMQDFPDSLSALVGDKHAPCTVLITMSRCDKFSICTWL